MRRNWLNALLWTMVVLTMVGCAAASGKNPDPQISATRMRLADLLAGKIFGQPLAVFKGLNSADERVLIAGNQGAVTIRFEAHSYAPDKDESVAVIAGNRAPDGLAYICENLAGEFSTVVPVIAKTEMIVVLERVRKSPIAIALELLRGTAQVASHSTPPGRSWQKPG